MRDAFYFEGLWLLLGLGGGGLLGGLSGHYAEGLAVGLIAILGRHLYHLVGVARRIDRRARFLAPFPGGAWGIIETAIAEQQQRSRRHRKRQLRFAQRFREAAVSVPEGLVILDKNFCVEWSNPAAERILGLHWPVVRARPFGSALPNPLLKAYLAGGDFAQPFDLVPEHNRAVRLSLRITPFGGEKRQWLVVARDVTKIHHLDQIRRDFVANASHELRTPLTVISGFLETLADSRETPPGMRRPVDLMRHHASRMQDIIEDLLALSRLEMGEHPEQVQPVDVPGLLAQVVSEVTAEDGGQGPIDQDIDPDLFLMGDATELRSAFANLIRNAIQHTPADARIQVIWRNGPQGPVLSVRDAGLGIEPEHIPRLTERFYRVDPARSRESGGTGVGLSIVNHVLSRHQGQLLIASEVGGGSEFTCRFATAVAVRRGAERSNGSVPAAQTAAPATAIPHEAGNAPTARPNHLAASSLAASPIDQMGMGD